MMIPLFLPPPLALAPQGRRRRSRHLPFVCVAGSPPHVLTTFLSVLSNPFRRRAALPAPEVAPDDDGLSERLAARRKVRKRPRSTPPIVTPPPGIPEDRAHAFLAEAARRPSTSLSSPLPYDLQREVFRELIPGRAPTRRAWLPAALARVADAARRKPPLRDETVYAAALAHEAIADGAAAPAAEAFATAAAIATTATAAINAPDRAALHAAVVAARAVATVDDANVFAETIGLPPLVAAARRLPGPDRAVALTALANLAIMLPKARGRLLHADAGSLVRTLTEVVLDSARFPAQSIWQTEALISGTHLLGSLALVRGKAGEEARCGMALDKELVRGLQRLAGGVKNGEPEGAARAARRALGTLGVNGWVPRMPGQRGLRILCIDGGGTRAIMAFETLKELKKATGCEIHELFDIIGGTSTGAIVAASIGIAHKTVEEVEVLYRDMIGKIFAKHPVNGPKMLLTRAYYDTKVLESTLQRECGKGVFIDSLAEDNMNRVFVVSSIMSRNPKELHIFRNYTYPIGHESRYDGTVEAQLWEGLRASSAAPTFFSEIRVNGELHADGAIVANNPTAVALHETKSMYPGVPIELLVSVGNGAPPAFVGTDEENEKKMGWGDVVGSILASATSTEVVHHAMQDLFPPDKYFRFNPITVSTQIDETNAETLASFVKEAQDYIKANRNVFERVASILRPKTPRSLWRRFRDALAKELQELQISAWDDDLYLP